MIQWTLIDTGSWIPAQQRGEKLQRLWNVHVVCLHRWTGATFSLFLSRDGESVTICFLVSVEGRGALWQGTRQQLASLSEARSNGIIAFIGGSFNTFPLGLAYFYISKLSSQNRASGRG